MHRVLAAALLLASAAAAAAPSVTFVTLGTQGGPVPSAERSQPANLLLRGSDATLIDVGDGAAGRLAAAGVPLTALRQVFVSHLHFDHTGGLAAILGLRYAVKAPSALTVYGPPGTRQLVEGIVASMQPTSEAGYGVPGEVRVPPEATVRVVELVDGEQVRLGDMTVTTAANSHYSFPPGSALARRFRSLSYRFDLPGRSIAYTGDTGPSPAVERLARGVDLLVSEMIDLPAVLDAMRRQSPNQPQAVFDQMARHLADHHLSPVQVGELAARSGAKRLVVTHLVGGAPSLAGTAGYEADIRRSYAGPVAIAKDLDRY